MITNLLRFMPGWCRALLLLPITCCLAIPASAQSAGAFSRIGFGTRGIAMGNALAADITGPASPYYNPALAPYARAQHLDISVASMSFDRSLQFIQLVSPMQKAGISLGLIHSSVSDIDGRDNSGFHTRDLSIDEYEGFLAFGIRMSNRLSGGLSFQLFRTDLLDGLDPVVTVAVDIGLAFRLSESFSLAFVADDLLGRYSWNTGGVNGSAGKKTIDYFPTRLRLGVAKMLRDGTLLLVAEIESRTTRAETVSSRVTVFESQPAEVKDRETITLQETRGRVGAEYKLMPEFALRAGLEQRGSDFLGRLRPSTGFMLAQEVGNLNARFEYTFARETRVSGSIHVFSLSLLF